MKKMLELITSWLQEGVEPPIPLEAQAKLLDKKYEIKEIEVDIYDIVSGETNKQLVPVIGYKEIICNYRPKIHLQDYWMHVQVIDGQQHFKFYRIHNTIDGIYVQHAVHPHLSGGIPCFGSHQGDINTAFSEGNFVRFTSQIKTYLCSYYGRSTYVKGTKFRKRGYKTFRAQSLFF